MNNMGETREQNLIRSLSFAASAYLIFQRQKSSDTHTYKHIENIQKDAMKYIAELDAKHDDVPKIETLIRMYDGRKIDLTKVRSVGISIDNLKRVKSLYVTIKKPEGWTPMFPGDEIEHIEVWEESADSPDLRSLFEEISHVFRLYLSELNR